MDTETGELKEQRLAHREVAEKFYRGLAVAGQRVRVGMEASRRGRKQKTDRQDAQHILSLLLKDDFPLIWVPGRPINYSMFNGTLRHALVEERHFPLVDSFAWPTVSSLVIVSGQDSVRPRHLFDPQRRS